MKLLIGIFIFSVNLLIAQNEKKTDRLYQNFSFQNDSLKLSEGVNPNEFNLININKELYNNYYNHVFSSLGNGLYSNAGHWSVPIKIYLDKRIDKSIKEDFIQFVTFLPKLDYLSISFVNKKEDANYYIYPVNKIIDDFDIDLYKGITYNLISDYSNKYFTARLMFNPEQIKDKTVIKTKLKQFFFATLGNFYIISDLKENSLLSTNYKITKTISDYDYTMLRFHYGLYNQNPINYLQLKKILKKLNNTTFSNLKGRYTITLEE